MFLSKLYVKWTNIAAIQCTVVILSLALLSPVTVHAFAFGDHNQKIATDIDATNGIVCDQQENKCIAKGNVKASRGQAVLTTDELTAFFKKDNSAAQSQKLSRFKADGHVVVTMTEQNQTATAEHAFYDIETGELIMIGKNLRLESDDLIITAQENLKYFEKKLSAVALGRATAQQKDQHIEADELRANFQKTADGKMHITQVFADGNVILTTPNETAYGQHGRYDQSSGIITLENDVRICYQQGENDLKLHGQRAEINMQTGQSRLINANSNKLGQDKVKVLLIPNPSPRVIK